MGKGERSLQKVSQPLSSSDLGHDSKLLTLQPIYNEIDDFNDESTPLWVLVSTYLSYFILVTLVII
jgi:hypothetical protein